MSIKKMSTQHPPRLDLEPGVSQHQQQPARLIQYGLLLLPPQFETRWICRIRRMLPLSFHLRLRRWSSITI